MSRSLIIHSHFYQPPRDNPFFDEVETEASAAPFHDWNQRIERECYRAVVAARVTRGDGRILRLLNTLEWMSFNVGATLFEWMEVEAPDTYRQFLAADRASLARLGHGNAMAQPYHHAILPLASRRDKVSEVRWGIADFRRRFAREPEGMWLPETAVDDETLDVLAQEGIAFTVLAPYQVKVVPPNGLPGKYVTANGRSIALFPYHGDISHGIAFGGLVRDAEHWWRAIHDVPVVEAKSPMLVSAATDGETYGHHHKFAEMALARVIERSREHGTRIENYASFLARHPASVSVELVAPSAWSCAHGVERWRSDCGCRIDGETNPSQAWRAPLRRALDDLASGVHAIFEAEGAALLSDPWRARDAWGAVVSSGDLTERSRFLSAWLLPGVGREGRARALELLEMERDALRMFTSCAWFFDDIGGLEVRQVLQYARRGIELSGARATLEPAFRATLGTAASNRAALGNGADVYERMQHDAAAEARVAAAARAVVDLQLPLEANLPPAMDATVDGDTVHVILRATGRTHTFLVTLERRTASDLTYRVSPLDGDASDAQSIPLAEFPERSRFAVRAALRSALLPRCLTLAELEQLASGEASLRGLIAVALTRAIARLTTDRGDDALDVVDATLDLFEQLETNIPFDAQTTFWRVLQSVPPAERPSLDALSRRLGFAT